MKKELKISTLSIVCVLCTAIAMPSFGASAVRSIGGAGTYSSASNAATAGSKTSSGSTNSVRAGSLRATGAKTSSATSSSSTRAAATPRLSIGKYLGGATTTKPSTGSGTIDPEQSGWNDRLEARVDKLEVGVKQLQEDLNDMTDGGYRISVEEKDGELTIYQGDKKVWSGNVGSAEGLEDLQDALDALTARVSANEVAIEDLNDLVADLQVAIDGKQAAGNYAAADALADLKADVEALQGSSVSDAVIQELNAKVSAIAADYITDSEMQSAVQGVKDLIPSLGDYAKIADLATVARTGSYDDLKNKPTIPSIEGLATAEALNNLQTTLQTAIDGKQAAGNYAAADALADLKADVEALQGSSVSDAVIQELNTKVDEIAADYITDSEMQSAVQGVKDLIPSLDGYLKADALDVITASVAGAQSTADAAKTAADAAQSMANLNAAELAGLADVAKTGSYNDLTDTPDLTLYVTENQVEQSVSTAINAYEIPDGSITADKIQDGAITSEKINAGTGNGGEMMMLMSNGDGTSSWVSVELN